LEKKRTPRANSTRLDRRSLLKGAGAAGVSAVAIGSGAFAPRSASADPPPFDFNTGNALIQVIIPAAIPAIFQTVSSNASDASLVLRVTTLITNVCFDAIAPYHPTAVGVYSRLNRQAPAEATLANKNVAILYATFHVLNSLLPQHATGWRAMLQGVGLDPDNNDQSTSNPIGIGNRAGQALVAAREQDGMNQLGDAGGQTYNRQPYANSIGYEPVNTAYKLKDPSRWQPLVVTQGNGIFRVQQFVTPQWSITQPYSYPSAKHFSVPPPVQSRPSPAYKRQVDEVLAASANLTDYQKMLAELVDNKLFSLGFSALFMAQSRGLTLDQFIQYDFLTNMAAFDAGIIAWKEKVRHDAVRPVSAIRHVYGNRPVTAWGGPGRGTVNDLPANEWRSYLNTADHPEYPSGSATFCAAHSQATRRFFDSDDFGWSVPVAAGSSLIEPGTTPAVDIVLGPWPTWTDFDKECGITRLWAGVHFMPSIVAGDSIGREIGNRAYDFLQAHLAGTV
jgi:hypothetical protein